MSLDICLGQFNIFLNWKQVLSRHFQVAGRRCIRVVPIVVDGNQTFALGLARDYGRSRIVVLQRLLALRSQLGPGQIGTPICSEKHLLILFGGNIVVISNVGVSRLEWWWTLIAWVHIHHALVALLP